MLGNLAIPIVASTVAGLAAGLLGLPFPIAPAVIAGAHDLIPQVGATIVAAIIVVGFALTASTAAAIAMLVIQL